MTHHVQDKNIRFLIALQTQRCKDWLKTNGFEVLMVLGGVVQPTIVIKPSTLCQSLDGIAVAYERTVRGTRRYSFVIRHGCKVEWEVV